MISQAYIILRCTLFIIYLLILAEGMHPQKANASNLILTHIEDEVVNDNPLWNELSEGFEASLRINSYGLYQGVASSTQNPDNDFLRIPRFLFDLDIRPDFYLHFRKLEFSVKPRAYLEWSSIEEGLRREDTDWKNDWYINEWLVRLGVTDSLFLSYGRENIQWGPSYLFSPSNPFFENNGRMNPNMEVAGMDFATLIWGPSIRWSLSLIANTGEGHQEYKTGKLHKSYAVKIDYTGNEGYIGFILSRREKETHRIGTFGGLTASDAVLLYTDIGFSRSSDVLYPVEDILSPFGVSMQALDEDSSKWSGAMMVGASYTFMAGPVISAEYLYNDAGYSNNQANQYYQLRHDASDAYYGNGLTGGISRIVLGQTVNPGIRFFRKNYLVLQYSQNDIKNVLNLSFSLIYNMDDRGGELVSNLNYAVGDHMQVFSVGCINTGVADSEFRSVLDSFLTIGLEYTF